MGTHSYTMTRGPKKHLKRLNAPSAWGLDKMSGIYATKVKAGPHAKENAIPLGVIVRHNLRLSQNYNETKAVLMGRSIKVDNKVVTVGGHPIGFMDILTIPKMKVNYRVLYDTKGRFKLQLISAQEATYKLLKVVDTKTGTGRIPLLVTHDGRTIKHSYPDIKKDDTIRFEYATGNVLGFSKFKVGAPVMITKGKSCGRIGHISVINHLEARDDYVTCVDSRGQEFTTVRSNVMVIGDSSKLWTTIPAAQGLKYSIFEQLKMAGKHEAGIAGMRAEYVEEHIEDDEPAAAEEE